MTLRNHFVDLGRLRQTVSSLSEGIIIVDEAGQILWANDTALRIHGAAGIADLGNDGDDYASRYELRYRNNHLLSKEDHPLTRARAGEEFSELVVEVTRAGDDEQGWIHQIRSLVLGDEKGKPDLFVLVIQDVSLRYEAEQRFEQTFNVNPAPAVICRLADHRYVKVNQGFLDLTGYTRDEVLGRSLYDIDVLQDAVNLDTAKERLRGGKTIPQMQADLSLPDGGRKLVIVAGQPIDLDEQPCMLFSFADLEPRRQVENELRHSEERFVKTFRLAPVGMAITTQDGQRLCDVNDAFHQLTGYSPDEALGKMMAELKLWDPASFLKEAEDMLAERSGFRGRDARVRTQDGSFVDCLVSAEAMPLRRDKCVLWVIQDIHERRHSELELITAIEAVMKDTNWFSRTVVEKLANLRAPHTHAAPVEVSELTRREKEVLSLLCEGGDDAAIAREMGVSRNTLRNHIARVYQKTGVNRRAAAILWARERGFPLARPIR
ncbi:PAS domain S-box protein [Sphingopyxis sp. LARHCG72]